MPYNSALTPRKGVYSAAARCSNFISTAPGITHHLPRIAKHRSPRPVVEAPPTTLRVILIGCLGQGFLGNENPCCNTSTMLHGPINLTGEINRKFLRSEGSGYKVVQLSSTTSTIYMWFSSVLSPCPSHSSWVEVDVVRPSRPKLLIIILVHICE